MEVLTASALGLSKVNEELRTGEGVPGVGCWGRRDADRPRNSGDFHRQSLGKDRDQSEERCLTCEEGGIKK